ncbi:MAG: amidohydrolase family protein [Dehalococcoidia bacterium]
MIVDAHVHLGDGLFGQRYSRHDLLAAMDEAGIDRAVVSPLKPRGYHFGAANDLVAEAVRSSNGRLLAFGRVDPWQGEAAVDEAERCFTQLGFKGLLLHPWEELFPVNDPIVFPLIDLTARHGCPIMLAGGYPVVSHPSRIADLAGRFPSVTFMVTSGGQINISGGMLAQAEAMLRSSPNVLMETSGIYREDFIEDMAAALGPERLIFGSGAPTYDPRHELDRIRRAHLPDAARVLIGGENLRMLLSWEESSVRRSRTNRGHD